MSPRPTPRLKSLTRTSSGLSAAERPRHLRLVGAEEDVAEGVPSIRKPYPAAGARIVGMLHITAPGRGAVPTATSQCDCGRDRSAVGHRRVHDLIADHTAHRDLCPLLNPTEGRDAT